jgi:hypothetical protein
MLAGAPASAITTSCTITEANTLSARNGPL